MLGCGGACHALVSDSVTPCQNVTVDDLTDGVAVSRGKCDGRSDGSSLKFSRPRDPGSRDPHCLSYGSSVEGVVVVVLLKPEM